MEIELEKETNLLAEIRKNAHRLQEIRARGKQEFLRDYILHNAAYIYYKFLLRE